MTNLTYVAGYILRWSTCTQTVTHPSANQAQHTSLVQRNVLSLPYAMPPITVSSGRHAGGNHWTAQHFGLRIKIDDFERPLTSKIMGFIYFCNVRLQRTLRMHCNEMAGDRLTVRTGTAIGFCASHEH